MKPTREPASSRPKPCASLKKPPDLARLPLLVALVGRKMTVVRHQFFPKKIYRFTPLILAHRGSALPWLVDDRPALRLRRIWCVPTRYSTTRLSATVLPASRVPPPSRRTPNWSSEEAHTWEHHPQPTIPPPHLNRQAESRWQPIGCISLEGVSPALHPLEKLFHTHTPKPGFGGRGREEVLIGHLPLPLFSNI